MLKHGGALLVITPSSFTTFTSERVPHVTSAETEAAAAIAGMQRAMQSLFPDATCSFQAGRYTRGCFIEPHDDVAFKDLEDAATGCAHANLLIFPSETPSVKP
jgi:hypothetical protein